MQCRACPDQYLLVGRMKSFFAFGAAAAALVCAESQLAAHSDHNPWDWNGGYPHGGE